MPGDRLPWFKCFPDDILLSPRVARMSPGEFGVYMKLLLHCYRNPDGTISAAPDDLKFYAGHGATQAEIDAAVAMLKPADGSKLTHEHVEANARLASNLASRGLERSESGRKGGLRSGKSRRDKNKEATASSCDEAKNEARSTEQNRTEQKADAPLGAARPPIPTPQSEPLTSPAGAAPAPGSQERPAPARPASAPKRDPNIGPPGSTLSENRLKVLLTACVPDKDHPRDTMRPWVTLTCSSWFDRQTQIDRDIWLREYRDHFGYDFNRGPQPGPPSGPPNAPARRLSWSPEPVSAPAGTDSGVPQ